MKFTYFILVLFFLSCKSVPITSDIYLKPEIESYGLVNGDTLLDIGCGDGAHAVYVSHFYPSSYFILEDIDANQIASISKYYSSANKHFSYIKDKYELVLGTPDTIPLPSVTYKNLLCRKTLHEFTNPKKMIQEMNRILVQGGKLIIAEAEPIKENEIDRFCKRRLLSKQKIIDLLVNQNFSFTKSAIINMKKNRKLVVLIFTKN
jgi:ubiquinone/menaquinone biosynthesis C-methylase UbiE